MRYRIVSIQLFIIVIINCVLFAFTCEAQRLDRFTSADNLHTLPYPKVVTYFGYIAPGSVPDEIRDGKNFYYLYFNISDTINEIGVRMISPVPVVVMPDKGNLVSENYYDNEKDKTNYFDTWIALEQAIDVKDKNLSPSDTSVKWTQLAFNDDARELFAQPSGKRNNSLLRIQYKITEPMLAPGFYRIAFTDDKTNDVKGGFVVQMGISAKLPGLKLVKNPDDLQ